MLVYLPRGSQLQHALVLVELRKPQRYICLEGREVLWYYRTLTGPVFNFSADTDVEACNQSIT